jgi:hypothetical protein
MLFPKLIKNALEDFPVLNKPIAIGKQKALGVVSPLAHTSGVDIQR